MPDFEVLGTGQSVDPTEPVSAAKTIAFLVVGGSILFAVLDMSRKGGSILNDTLSRVTGRDVDGSGESVTESIGGGF